MWLVIWLFGLLTGIAVAVAMKYIKDSNMQYKWYHWVIGVVLYLGLALIIGFVATSIGEGEPQAAKMGLLIFGGTYLVITILLYRFVYAGRGKAGLFKKEASA